jgi:hypothetical protein
MEVGARVKLANGIGIDELLDCDIEVDDAEDICYNGNGAYRFGYIKRFLLNSVYTNKDVSVLFDNGEQWTIPFSYIEEVAPKDKSHPLTRVFKD